MLTDNCEKSFIEKIFKDIANQQEQENNPISNSIELESTTKDDIEEIEQQFEYYLRKSLEDNLKLEKIKDEKLKKFEIFEMKLFDAKKKKFLSTKSFYCDKKYYWINDGDKNFIIKKGYFSTLYYCDYKTKKYKIIRGIDETKQNDAKFIYLKKENEPVPENEQKNDKLIPSKSCDDKKESVPKNEEEEFKLVIIEEDKTAN